MNLYQQTCIVLSLLCLFLSGFFISQSFKGNSNSGQLNSNLKRAAFQQMPKDKPLSYTPDQSITKPLIQQSSVKIETSTSSPKKEETDLQESAPIKVITTKNPYTKSKQNAETTKNENENEFVESIHTKRIRKIYKTPDVSPLIKAQNNSDNSFKEHKPKLRKLTD
ncbi:MAG TPA: hypothetical protein V6C96_00190 [Vampirovibrionales bacterium]